jgi:hypothetical protein
VEQADHFELLIFEGALLRSDQLTSVQNDWESRRLHQRWMSHAPLLMRRCEHDGIKRVARGFWPFDLYGTARAARPGAGIDERPSRYTIVVDHPLDRRQF